MRHIETVQYRPQKWDREDAPVVLSQICVKIFENSKGTLDLHFKNKDETFKVIGNVCPDHFSKDWLDFFWGGLEDGFEIGIGTL